MRTPPLYRTAPHRSSLHAPLYELKEPGTYLCENCKQPLFSSEDKSEHLCVVIPLHTTHFKLLHKNLLYTGLTRAKKIAIFVGSRCTLSIAVKNDEVHTRYTGLQEILRQSL